MTSSPARPPDWRSRAARWRSTRSVSSAARAPSASSTASASSSTSRRPLGPPLTMPRSSGEKMVHGAAAPSSLPAVDRLAVDPGPAPARRQDLRLDQRGAVAVVDLGADDGALGARAHHGLGRRAAEGAAGAEIGQRLEHARLAGAVRARDDGGALGFEVELHGAEDAEVGQLQVPDAHRDRGLLRRPGPASGGSGTPDLRRRAPWRHATRRRSRRSPRRRRPPRRRR